MSCKRIIALLLGLSISSVAAADSWVMSIPYALSSEHVYKVRIERIDGKEVANALRYSLAVGEHTVTVSPLLDVEWSPDLVENPRDNPRSKDLKLTLKQGKTDLKASGGPESPYRTPQRCPFPCSQTAK